MMRKWTLLLALLLLFNSNTFVFGQSQPSSWALSFVNEIKNSGQIEVDRLMDRYQSRISRAEFAFLAVRLYEYYTGTAAVIGDAKFSDTNDVFILQAKNLGIVSGYPDGTFRPMNSIRRDELATLFVNLFKAAGVSFKPAALSVFSDDDAIAAWAKESVYIARANDIVSGVGSNKFDPAGSATIEESLVMLYKGMTQIERISVVGKALTPSEISKLVSPSVVYIELYDERQSVIGSGSGFIISENGQVVTNYHVIEKAKYAKIKLIDQRVFSVNSILAYDIDRDIAVLKVEATGLPAATLGNSAAAVNGDQILTIGSPIGLENTISDGLISNRSRDVNGQNYIQISAPISPGSSGGVLLNSFGHVIGVTSAGFNDGQNLNLAIPINDVKSILGEISGSGIAFGTHVAKETEHSDADASATLTYDAYAGYVLDYYSPLTIGGITVRFSEVRISDTYDLNQIFIFMYIENDTFGSLLKMSSDYRQEIVSSLGEIAEEAAGYYGKPASIAIIYTDEFDFYPSAFLENALYDDTITYISENGRWLVFYPFVQVDFIGDDYYYYEWAF